jgi:predicted Zn-dependent protease
MAGLLGASTLVSPALLHAVEPHIQDKPYNTLTEEEEIALGRKFSEEYEKKVEIMHNPVIDAYLNHIIRKLGDASQRPHWPYQVRVVNSAVVNACAIPGGFLCNAGFWNMSRTRMKWWALWPTKSGMWSHAIPPISWC